MAYGLVNDSGAREQYTALAAETNFAYPFEIFANGDLTVWLTPVGQTPDPVLDLLVLNSDYTVTGAGAEGGGDVILNTPATAGDIITIERDIPIERLADYSVGGDFSGASINQQLDKLTMTQQQNEMVNEKRQLTYFSTDQLLTGDVNLPKLANGQFWKKGDAGALVAVTLEESAGWSALRSELANNLSGSDGARLVGYYNSQSGSSTVHNQLDHTSARISHYGVTTGTPNAYLVTLNNITSYFNGLTIKLKIHQPNTGAATININGLGAKSLRSGDLTELLANDFDVDRVFTFVYTGTYFTLDEILPAYNARVGGVSLRQTVRAWAVYDGATPTLERDYNILSVTKNAPGDYTFNLDNITSVSNKYVVQVAAVGPLVGAPDGVMTQSVTGIANNNFSIKLLDTAGILRDSNQIYVAVIGDDFVPIV